MAVTNDSRTLDGNPEVQAVPYKMERSPFPGQFERQDSGGLSDDPTESGEPVRNRRPYKNLQGGR